MTRIRRRCAAGLLALLLAGLGGGAMAGPGGDAAAIRTLRADYNHAFEARRADLIPGFVAADTVLVDSSGAVIKGGQALADDYAAVEFKDPAFIAYDRRPLAVEVSADGRFAAERGRWRARFRKPGGGERGASGVYSAGWVKTDGTWQVRTELYVKLVCADPGACR